MSVDRRVVATLTIVALAFVTIPPFVPSYIQHILILVLFYAYLATAWNILGGYAGQPSLGHALFIGAGAYVSTLLFVWLRLSPWAGMFAGAMIASLFGLFIGYLSFRYRVKGPYFAVVTMAFAQIFVYIAANTRALGGASGIVVPLAGNSPLQYQFEGKLPYYYIVLVLLAFALGVTYWLRCTKIGYYFMAIRDNEEAAQALGIDLMRYRLLATIISAALSAIGGTFYAQYVLFIDPPSVLGVFLSFEVTIYAVVGGMGTVFGPALGALLLVPTAEFARSVLGRSQASGVHLMIYGAFLVFTILFLREGIMGWLSGILFPRRKSLPERTADGNKSIDLESAT